MKPYIDLGPYLLEKAEAVDLNKPSTLPGFTTEGIVTEMGAGVVRGDGPNSTLAPLHSESQRLADVLNRLSLNGLDQIQALTVLPTLYPHEPTVYKLRPSILTPEELVAYLQATGHTVNVYDARYFANFGHFHFKGQEVMMPFWLDSQIAIPGEAFVAWFP